MLLRIPHAPINHRSQTAQLLRPSRHKTTPARRVHPLRLLDVHDMALLIGVGEMHRRRRAGTVRLDHFHRNCWSIDAPTTRGVHFESV